MNYLQYIKDKDEKNHYWTNYAVKILSNPKSTESEIKCAIIGIRNHNKNLAQQLKAKKPHKLKI